MAEQVLIETYRGWDISFDIDNETFIVYSSIWDEEQKEKKSYAACKKYIDDSIKSNEKFKPIKIICPSSMYHDGDTKTLTGIRKDGRFTYETDKGKTQLPEYNEKQYFIYEDWMNDVLIRAADIQKEIENLRNRKKLLMETEFEARAENLVDYKKKHFNQ